LMDGKLCAISFPQCVKPAAMGPMAPGTNYTYRSASSIPLTNNENIISMIKPCRGFCFGVLQQCQSFMNFNVSHFFFATQTKLVISYIIWISQVLNNQDHNGWKNGHPTSNVKISVSSGMTNDLICPLISSFCYFLMLVVLI
jgi:hypothetical protein